METKGELNSDDIKKIYNSVIKFSQKNSEHRKYTFGDIVKRITNHISKIEEVRSYFDDMTIDTITKFLSTHMRNKYLFDDDMLPDFLCFLYDYVTNPSTERRSSLLMNLMVVISPGQKSIPKINIWNDCNVVLNNLLSTIKDFILDNADDNNKDDITEEEQSVENANEKPEVSQKLVVTPQKDVIDETSEQDPKYKKSPPNNVTNPLTENEIKNVAYDPRTQEQLIDYRNQVELSKKISKPSDVTNDPKLYINDNLVQKTELPDDNLQWSNKDEIEQTAKEDFNQDIVVDNNGVLEQQTIPNDTQEPSVNDIFSMQTSDEPMMTPNEIRDTIDANIIRKDGEDRLKIEGSVNARNNIKYRQQIDSLIGYSLQNTSFGKITDNELNDYVKGVMNDTSIDNFHNKLDKYISENNRSKDYLVIIRKILKTTLKDINGELRDMSNEERPLPIEYVTKFTQDFDHIVKNNHKLFILIKFLENEYIEGFDPNDISCYFKFEHQKLQKIVSGTDENRYTFGNLITKQVYDSWEPEKQEVWKDNVAAMNKLPQSVIDEKKKIKEKIMKTIMYANYERYKYFKLYNVSPDVNMIDANKSINTKNKKTMKEMLEEISKMEEKGKNNSIYKYSKLTFRTGGADSVISDNVPFLQKLSFRYKRLNDRYENSDMTKSSQTVHKIYTDEAATNHYNDATYIANYDTEGARNPKNIQDKSRDEQKYDQINNAINNITQGNKLYVP